MVEDVEHRVVDNDEDSMESTKAEPKEPSKEEEINFKHYIKKDIIAYLFILTLLFTLAFVAGYWMAYDKAIVEVTKVFVESFKDCICPF